MDQGVFEVLECVRLFLVFGEVEDPQVLSVVAKHFHTVAVGAGIGSMAAQMMY